MDRGKGAWASTKQNSFAFPLSEVDFEIWSYEQRSPTDPVGYTGNDRPGRHELNSCCVYRVLEVLEKR